MTKAEIIKIIHNETGYSSREVSEIIDSFTTVIGNALIHGDTAKVTEFGTFKTKETAPREIVNIYTGKSQLTKIRRKIVFIPCTELKNAVK